MGNYNNLVLQVTDNYEYEVSLRHPLLDKRVLRVFKSRWLAWLYFNYLRFRYCRGAKIEFHSAAEGYKP
ncbi:MAG: hypothetical protein J6Y02_01340 [Pseudobutyrivibrio sp.]|nr:hypothetical protein [Pseudobutyrivibrio sp.]